MGTKSSERARAATNRIEAALAGYCNRCCKGTPASGYKTCEACRQYVKAKCHEHYMKAKLEGRCLGCRMAEPVPGLSVCQKCRERVNRWDKTKRKKKTSSASGAGKGKPQATPLSRSSDPSEPRRPCPFVGYVQ